MKISKTQLAVLEGRTIFKSQVKDVNDYEPPILKKAEHNKKLGNGKNIITKGKWKGYPLFYLTLEERKTCPTSCHFWNNCYGNNMYMAHRVTHGLMLQNRIQKELKELFKKYDNIVIRLHVLGDFYSESYVKFWRRMLLKYDGLHLFGYTARLEGIISIRVQQLNYWFKDRVSIRFSTNQDNLKLFKNVYNQGLAVDETYKGRKFICPESTGKVDSCLDCGLCFSQTIKKAVMFPTH